MPHGVHNTVQTGFRLPEGLLARLREQAAIEASVTMTDIVVRALEAEFARLDGITTRVTTIVPASPVSPPRARKPRADTAAPARQRHATTCKCATCKPPREGAK
jgi:hypothetical protein